MQTKPHGRRFFAVLLTLAMLMSAVPLTGLTAFAATSGDFEYKVLSETDKTCEITDYTGSATELDIPSELDGYTVTSIGGEAFYGCASLISVTIPNRATRIGNGAFNNCTSLVSINIPNSVTTIEEYAFQNCTSLKEVVIPDKITSIEYHTFTYCSSLKNITLPNGVTRIEDEAFRDCVSLTSISLPNSVASIGSAAFYNTAYYNDNANWEDGVLYIGNHCIAAKSNISGAYTIELGTKTIADRAFYDCKQLNGITLPNSVIHIGYLAFWKCEMLTNIVLPDSLMDIGASAFADTACYNNDANWENGVLYIGNHCIEAKRNISGAYTIKSGTKSIAASAFGNCYSLTAITLPESVIYISDSAFSECDLTIYGTASSYAETYAAREGIPFVALNAAADDATGVSVLWDTIAPEGIQLSVEQVELTDTAITYDITLTQNGAAVQPAGAVTVKIPVPDGMDGNACKVYREEADGSYTDMNAAYQDGYMVFTTDHFSVYVLTAENLQGTPGDVNADGKVDAVDARWVLQAAAGMRTLENATAAADVNTDSKIDAVDARWILQAAAGMRTLDA